MKNAVITKAGSVCNIENLCQYSVPELQVDFSVGYTKL